MSLGIRQNCDHQSERKRGTLRGLRNNCNDADHLNHPCTLRRLRQPELLVQCEPGWATVARRMRSRLPVHLLNRR